MINTLKAKQVLVLFCLMSLVGCSALLIGQAGMRLYYEELTQKQNQSIAMYVTREHRLLADEVNSKQVIDMLSQQAMIINPIAEVYLLDTKGRIISHSFSGESILRKTIDLKPIKEFLARTQPFPLRGNDPQDEQLDRIFSASEVHRDGKLQGYFYVVLGGRGFEDLYGSVSWSHVGKNAGGLLMMIIISSLIIGWFVFNRLVHRLTKLNRDMCSFSQKVLMGKNEKACSEFMSGDEIDQLSAVFQKMSEKICLQLEQLRESDRLRRELISNVSHDLRTPLATTQGYLETLIIKNDSIDSQMRNTYLRVAEKSCRRLGRLIADLFELSKLETGSIRLECEYFSIVELMYDTVQGFQIESQKKGISIGVDCPQNDVQVHADISLIQRVFENLIRNAIAHTPDGGRVQLQFTEMFSDDPSAVHVAVEDTGRGIKRHDIPHIFNRSYRSAQQPQSVTDSSGLGLAIVKKILDLHGCRIEVVSEPGRGARFQFDLPTLPESSYDNEPQSQWVAV